MVLRLLRIGNAIRLIQPCHLLIGKVSSSEAGLPQEDAKEYLKSGMLLMTV